MSKDAVKLILGYDKYTKKVIEELMRYFGVENKAYLIRKGLALLELLRETNQNGDDFAIVNKELTKIKRIMVRPPLEEWVILDWKQMQTTDNLPRFTPAMESSLILYDQDRILIRGLTRNKAEKLAEELSGGK